jgi:hypothetical protein
MLWDGLEPFLNMRQTEADAKLRPLGTEPIRVYQDMRYVLQELVEGRLRLDGKVMPAVPLALAGSRKGRMSWTLRQVIDPLRAAAEAPADLRAQFKFLLGLLALPAVRPRLKQCPTCHAFMLKRAVRRTGTRRAFCSTACQRRAPGRREANARRQREYRERNPGRRTRA